MPRNASGIYTQPSNTQAVQGNIISPDAYNSLITDIGTELTNSLDRQGRSAMGANLPMGGFKVTGAANPTAAQDLATKTYVDTAQGGAALYLPPGALMDFAMPTAPSGWLECNGAAVSRTTYAALFLAIGTTWGSGDGSTTFNLPDMRGYFRRGWDHGAGVDAGRSFASTQSDELKSHNHGVTDPGHLHSYSYGTAGGATVLLAVSNASAPGTQNTGSSTTGISINSTGGTETRPKNVAVLTCIRT